MARQPLSRLWLAMVVVAAGVGLAGGLVGGGPYPGPPSPAVARDPGASSFTPTAVEAALVPVRTETAPTAGATRPGSGRGLLPLVAALLGLVGVLGTRAGVARPPASGGQPLRTRRHTIARRGPPSPLLV